MSDSCIKPNEPSIRITVKPNNFLREVHFKMKIAALVLVSICCFAAFATANVISEQEQRQIQPNVETTDTAHTRSKRTLFLKKKLIGAGLLGFGLGIAKGFKIGYHGYPDVHHIYSSPPVRYVEYVDKPVFVQRIVEKPVFKQSYADYHEISYGGW